MTTATATATAIDTCLLHTTRRLARKHDACEESYKPMVRRLKELGEGKWGMDRPIGLDLILETLGIDDALWSLRAVSPGEESARDRIARLFAADCAERVLPYFEKHYPDDPRPRKAIEVVRESTSGTITSEELATILAAARDDTWNATRAACRAAPRATRDAAWSAWSAALSNSWDAAFEAARGARDVAWSAAGDVVPAALRMAAQAAEKQWQADRLLAYLRGATDGIHP